MPEFEDLGSDHPDRFKLADEWRAMFAPARRVRRPKEPAKGAADTADDKKGGEAGERSIPPIDYAGAVPADFEAEVVRQGEIAVHRAFARHEHALKHGGEREIAATLAAWTDACRAAGTVRERFLKLGDQMRSVIGVDAVLNVIGPELEGWRVALIDLGIRVAPDANPDDPALAARAINIEVDRILKRLGAVAEMVRQEAVA